MAREITLDLINKKTIIDENGCRLYQGSSIRTGYCQISGTINGVWKAHWYVHRLAYLLTHGEIPEGLEVMHLCHNRRCCEPSHLTAGTHQKNIRMRTEIGNDPIGEKNGNAVLTWESVRGIRQRYRSGEITHRTLFTM